VIENQPELASRIKKVCLPGDYIALRLTGELVTTAAGLSEGILWDSKQGTLATELLDAYEIDSELIPPVVATFSNQGRVIAAVAAELGIPAGIPVSYRAGDQPNNALSLGVLEPGEIAATAGTSGVVYAVSDTGKYDPDSRVNVFLHVNHQHKSPRYGTLLCINGCGILNSWIQKTLMFSESAKPLSYREMDQKAASIAPGSEGLYIYPYGNGAERSLRNRAIGASFVGLDLNRHQRAHIFRAAQEGIVFALTYGFEALQSLGAPVSSVRAGMANMFQSPVFQSVFSNTTGVPLSLYNTDGSCGAARGAAIGAGLFSEPAEAFNGLKVLHEILPEKTLSSQYREVYNCWKQNLEAKLLIK
jgi:xylulokinase